MTEQAGIAMKDTTKGAEDGDRVRDLAEAVADRTPVDWEAEPGADRSIRALQADYIPTRISGTWEQHFRISSGITWTFGYTQSR